MEKKFLAYVLYITLVEFREKAYLNNDSRTFHLADILHNVPISLLSENSSKEEYLKLIDAVNSLGLHDWFKAREKEFKERYGNGE